MTSYAAVHEKSLLRPPGRGVRLKEDKAFRQRWIEGAQAISRLYVSLINAPFERYEREFLELQRTMLVTSAKTDWERQETRRRIAEEILLGAWGTDSPWEDFGRALRRIRRLGYSSVERRVHVAILFARWAQRHPEHLPEARRMLALAEQHSLSLSTRHSQYKDVRRSLASIRQDPEFAPPSTIAASTPPRGR
jgi:hypothetical protein